jgi:hypothetical protein
VQLFENFQHANVRSAARAAAGEHQAHAQALRGAGNRTELRGGSGALGSLCIGDAGGREPLKCEK